MPRPLPQSKWWHNLPYWVELPSPSETTSKVTPEEPPIQSRRRKCSSIKHCQGVTRKPSAGIPNWGKRQERITTRKLPMLWQQNMVDIFWNMMKSAGLLSSKIYEIKETWTGWSELQYSNYTLRTLPKGLRFFCPVSPSDSQKVMDLTGIHHPNALHHFSGVTHCPWCGKEGQNEGTVINHLQMTHYKLGLVCKKMLPLSLSHIQGHLAPWPQELSAICRRRPQQIVFIDLTASTRYAKPT